MAATEDDIFQRWGDLLIPALAGSDGWGESQSWRDYRTLTKKQRVTLDFVTNQGPFAKTPRKQPFALYGGAGWGGKSYLLRSAAFEICMVLRDLGFPDSWGVLYTDTYDNLKDRHIQKFVQEFAGIGTYSETAIRGHHVKFHGEGMGGVYLRNMVSSSDTKANKNTKRGAERRFALWEELTEFSYEQFCKGMYTVRPDIAGLPFVACLGATNPDGIGHQWVKEVFHPQYRNVTHDFFRSYSAANILFVQALKQDNPAYLEMKEVIDARMAMETDEDIRRARDEGAWDLYASGRFPTFKESVHGFEWDEIFERFGIPEGMGPKEFLPIASAFGFETYASLDYATSPDAVSAYLQHLVDPNDHLWTFRKLRMVGKQLEDQADLIKAAEEGLTMRARFADPAIAGKAAEGKGDLSLSRQARFRKLGLKFKLAINDRIEGAASCEWVLSYRKDAEGKVLRLPRARLLRAQADGIYGVPELIREIPNLPRDPLSPEDVSKDGGIHHWYDSWRYMVHTKFKGSRPVSTQPEWGSPAHFYMMGKRKPEPTNDW